MPRASGEKRKRCLPAPAAASGHTSSQTQSNTVTPLEETAGAVRLGCEVVTVVEASDSDGGCRGVGKLDGEVDVGERVL